MKEQGSIYSTYIHIQPSVNLLHAFRWHHYSVKVRSVELVNWTHFYCQKINILETELLLSKLSRGLQDFGENGAFFSIPTLWYEKIHGILTIDLSSTLNYVVSLLKMNLSQFFLFFVGGTSMFTVSIWNLFLLFIAFIVLGPPLMCKRELC